jgi:hypothetical protein
MSTGNIEVVAESCGDGVIWVSIDYAEPGTGLFVEELTLEEACYLRDEITGAIEAAERFAARAKVAPVGDENRRHLELVDDEEEEP